MAETDMINTYQHIYQNMYQEFKKLVDHRSQDEQDALFALNAMRIYRAWTEGISK